MKKKKNAFIFCIFNSDQRMRDVAKASRSESSLVEMVSNLYIPYASDRVLDRKSTNLNMADGSNHRDGSFGSPRSILRIKPRMYADGLRGLFWKFVEFFYRTSYNRSLIK